jgi:hypothetical protein
MAARKFPSYNVEILGQGYRGEPFVITLYTARLSSEEQNWWYTKRITQPEPPSEVASASASSPK